MELNRWLRLFAGTFVLASVALAQLHSAWWLVLTALVGLNQIQSAFTGWCPMMSLLRALGVPELRERNMAPGPDPQAGEIGASDIHPLTPWAPISSPPWSPHDTVEAR
ncbi:MAG: DUF2892 domain-containing protein [Candidatus Bipolaricaulia bacterium]